jgi:hypothetical protein
MFQIIKILSFLDPEAWVTFFVEIEKMARLVR